jgi:hypothetical protein
MDTLQLNKINELAREYLRLGIAKGSSDAVEKARFQLAFEAQRTEPEPSPYDALFNARTRAERQSGPKDEAARTERAERAELSPLDLRKDRFDEFTARINEIEGSSEKAFRHQQSRIAELEENLATLRNEVSKLKTRPQAPAQPVASHTSHEPTEGPIATTIEQTIKGRTITSADVAVDKIFYFGNR